MAEPKEYFDLKIEHLQILAEWAADCAEMALGIFEKHLSNDPRPRKALAGAREFAQSGKRTHTLRKLAMDAYRASIETRSVESSAAAQAASLAAASAYTHPFRDIKQARHILGPAAYAALALEVANDSERKSGDNAIQTAIATAPVEIALLLREMPRQIEGKKRIDELFYELDTGIRSKYKDDIDPRG